MGRKKFNKFGVYGGYRTGWSTTIGPTKVEPVVNTKFLAKLNQVHGILEKLSESQKSWYYMLRKAFIDQRGFLTDKQMGVLDSFIKGFTPKKKVDIAPPGPIKATPMIDLLALKKVLPHK